MKQTPLLILLAVFVLPLAGCSWEMLTGEVAQGSGGGGDWTPPNPVVKPPEPAVEVLVPPPQLEEPPPPDPVERAFAIRREIHQALADDNFEEYLVLVAALQRLKNEFDIYQLYRLNEMARRLGYLDLDRLDLNEIDTDGLANPSPQPEEEG